MGHYFLNTQYQQYQHFDSYCMSKKFYLIIVVFSPYIKKKSVKYSTVLCASNCYKVYLQVHKTLFGIPITYVNMPCPCN